MTSDIRVLTASADQTLATSINLALTRKHHIHRSETTVPGAIAALAAWAPDLLLVDLDLGRGAGIQLIDAARERVRTGVIALTRRSDMYRELDVYARGADDYVRVPFGREELAARAGAVVRRARTDPSVSQVRIGDLEIDVLNRKVISGGRELHLTSLEQGVLSLLVANAGNVLSRDDIRETLWGTEFVTESNIVERHVRALRAKLRDDWHKPRYIETVRGIGYRLLNLSPVGGYGHAYA